MRDNCTGGSRYETDPAYRAAVAGMETDFRALARSTRIGRAWARIDRFLETEVFNALIWIVALGGSALVWTHLVWPHLMKPLCETILRALGAM